MAGPELLSVEWINACGAFLGGVGSTAAAVFAWLAARQSQKSATETTATAERLVESIEEQNDLSNRPRLIAYVSGESISCCSGRYQLTIENIGKTPAYNVQIRFSPVRGNAIRILDFWKAMEGDGCISAIPPRSGIRHSFFDAAPHDLHIGESITGIRDACSVTLKYEGRFSDTPTEYVQDFPLEPKNIENVYALEQVGNPRVNESSYHEHR